MAATSLEAPALSRDTINDIYNLKVQVGAEHAFPVVALDVPVAEVSPLAGHFADYEQEQTRSTTSGVSALPVVDEPAPAIDEAGTADATSLSLRVPSPVAAVDEAEQSEETGKILATGNVTVDNHAATVDVPPPGVKDASLSAGDSVWGVTDAGIADTSAAFGVVDISALMAEETPGNVSPNVEPLVPTADKLGAITETGIADTTAAFGVVDVSALAAEETAGNVSPNVKPPSPTANLRCPRRSLSPGCKGYVNADASSASPEAVGPTRAVDSADVSLQTLPGDAAGHAGATDPYANYSPVAPTVDVCSPNNKNCVIS